MFHRFKIVFCILLPCWLYGQDAIQINGLQMYYGNQAIYTNIAPLNQKEGLHIEFDIMGNAVKRLYYTLQYCNADWTENSLPSNLYLKGFQEMFISNYKFSRNVKEPYIHYKIDLPNDDIYPIFSGNYLLKVFEENTQTIVLTQKIIFYNNQLGNLEVSYQKPIDRDIQQTHWQFNIQIPQGFLNIINPQQELTIAIIPHHNLNNILWIKEPTISTTENIIYNSPYTTLLPAINGFRHLDISSFNFNTGFIQKIINDANDSTRIYLYPENNTNRRYRGDYQKNLYGRHFFYSVENYVDAHYLDYMWVYFRFLPSQNLSFDSIYLLGSFNQFNTDEFSKMELTREGFYEKKMWLKKGIYNYYYATMQNNILSFQSTEGFNNLFSNHYTILVYYRKWGDNKDIIVGYKDIYTTDLW